MAQPNPFAALTFDPTTGTIGPTPKPSTVADPFNLGLDRPAGTVVLPTQAAAPNRSAAEALASEFAGLELSQPSSPEAYMVGAAKAMERREALPVAPPQRQYAPQAAMQAAAARDLGLPQSLRPRGGMDYGVYYDARVDAALAAGEITPEKAAAAKAQYAKFRETPLGLQFESMRAEPQLVQELGKLKLEQMSTEERLSERAAEAQAKVDAQLADSERIYAEQRKATEAELVGKQREMDAIRADIAATKIDPQNYFSSAPAWAKVLSILSVGIGGFASGWSGGRIPNTALAQLNAAIDRDIEAQKANLAKKRGEFGAAQGVYAQVRQKLGDDEQAYNFTRALLLNQGARAAQALAGEGRTAGIRNAAAQTSEQLKFQAQQAERNALGIVLQQQLAEREREARARFAASPAGRAAAAASDEARLQKERLKGLKLQAEEKKLIADIAKYGREAETGMTAQEAEKQAEAQERLAASYVSAAGGYVSGGATEAGKLRQNLAVKDQLVSYADQAIDIIKQNPVAARVPGTDASNALNVTKTLINAAVSTAHGQGALSDDERATYEDVLSTGFVAGVKPMEQLKGLILKNREATIGAYDVIPATRTVTEQGPRITIRPGGAPAAPRIREGW